MVGRRLALTALVLLLLSGPARGFTLLEDPFEGDELTLGASIKSFTYAMHGDVLRLLDESPAAQGVLVLRPQLEAQLGETWRLALHYDMVATASSLPLNLGALGAGLGQSTPPPRFLPLHVSPVSEDRFVWRHNLDWAWLRARFGPVDVTLGRQPVTFGRARFWPTLDLLAPFSPTAIDTEFKPGVDALRLDFTIARRHSLSLVAVAGEAVSDHDAEATLAGSAFAARGKLGFDKWELGGFAGYVRRDAVFGLDAFVDLAVVTLHAELAATWVPDGARSQRDGEAYLRSTLGLVWSIPRFKLVGELHYNGQGAASAGGYLARMAGPRFAVGELYTAGRYYAGLLVDWEPHPLLHLSLATLSNLRDPSALLAPSLAYSAATNVSLVAGALLPLGAEREGLAARSEFGLYPYVYYLELRLSM